MQALGIIDRLPRIAVAQAHRANPLYRSFEKNFDSFEPIAHGPPWPARFQIGNPVSGEKAIHTLKTFGGVVAQASEQELADAVARADRTACLRVHTRALRLRRCSS